MSAERSFDYIIVGSGPAGSVLAYRLCRDQNARVLLLEAGGDATEFVRTKSLDLPSLFSLWGPETDWGFVTEPMPGMNGMQMPIIQGKLVGGGSSNNGRIYIRGHQRDYDNWNYLGNEGWGWQDVLPYFKKSEDYVGEPSEYHGVGGPMPVMPLPSPSPVSQALVAAAKEVLGCHGPVDLNGADKENVAGYTQSTTTRNMERASTAVAYIDPIRDQPNFTLETRAFATRVLIEGNRAVGVEYLQDGQTHQARADKEVIVAAGAFGSPKLLMLSGIGPADHLQSLGISVVSDLPGVGQNLQDHLLARMAWVATEPQPDPICISEANIFTYTRPGLAAASPDIQFLFSPFLFPNPYYTGPGFTMVPGIEQPTSVGWVKLRSSNPLDHPVIQANFLSTQYDVDVLLWGIKRGRDLIASSAFDGLRGPELLPGPDVKTDKEIVDYIRNTAITEWHPSCTCKMGRDSLAVVDPQLRVYGVDSLRVIDSSIMPKIVNANLQATIIMIGEKGADLVMQSA